MRKRCFIEAEALRDLRLDDALPPQIQELGCPAAQAFDLPPHVSEIDAEHALIGIHERQRIELQPRRARKHAHHPENVALLAAGGFRNPEHAEPTGRRENAIALLPGCAADGIENELDATALGDLARAR